MDEIKKLKLNRAFRIVSYGAIFAILVGLPGYWAYTKSVKAGLQAEAHLIMSYIGTLQKAYHFEHGEFLAFPFYGAKIGAKENCEQPPGAAKLGFQINWCSGDKSVEPIRYAYQVKLSEDDEQGYILTAHSGSDERGYSFVCFGHGEADIWRMNRSQKKEHILECDTPELQPTKTSLKVLPIRLFPL